MHDKQPDREPFSRTPMASPAIPGATTRATREAASGARALLEDRASSRTPRQWRLLLSRCLDLLPLAHR